MAISIYDLVEDISKQNKRFDLKIKKCRDAFNEFLLINDCFGLEFNVSPEGSFEVCDIRKNDIDRIKPNLELWVSSYGTNSEEKLKLLTTRLKTLFPKTGDLFSKFIKFQNQPASVAWKLADYLCFSLVKEVVLMSDEELESLADRMNQEIPLKSARMFSNFLIYLRKRKALSNGVVFSFNSRGEKKAKEAYSVSSFLKMAYIIFNETSWEKENLIFKAMQSENDANLWLYTAMHFICAWRSTDILRLPLPTSPCGGEIMRQRVSDGTLNTEPILKELEFRVSYLPMQPNKTKEHNGIPTLKLFIPESLREPFGKILAIAMSYHDSKKAGECFVKKPVGKMQIKTFFGNDFIEACEERLFSSVRANKAYLQGIEMMADSSEGRPKGYMLAAIARSHKGGFGTLPQTTDVYLKDARFSGYKPEFIAKEMFERGVFSFIPALMMEMYAEDNYTNLPISVQTKLISEIGIKSSELEEITKMVNYSLQRANVAITNIMKHPEDIRGSMATILQNIASGNAPGRQEGFLCLKTAAGIGCGDSDRSSCIGCGYEIYTKTILHCLSKEYARLVALKKESNPSESCRYTKILKEAVMPAITEIFVSIKQMYPEVDLKSMIDITEKGALIC